jgi:glycosyltransferase involved in cell wall biosynthesis
LKVCHITYWYPNKNKIHEGNFIRNHINGLSSYCDNSVFHIQVKQGSSFLKIEKTESSIIYYSRFFKYYRIQEWLTFIALFNFFFIKKKARKADIINFHIATPLGRYLKFFNYFLNKKIVITEHWTAYYRNFNLPKKHKGLDRIKRIFYKKIHLITVSKALANDIKEFSGNKNINFSVIPNIVDSNTFSYTPKSTSEIIFFMVTNWNPEKNPFPIFHALTQIKETHSFQLRIAGDGILIDKMKESISFLNLNDRVSFLGRIEPKEIASEFQNSSAFLHSSFYETFSVVCAESLCSGCPVIATNIPAIKEYLDSDSGALVEQFEQQLELEDQAFLWNKSISNFINRIDQFQRQQISLKYSAMFGEVQVGNRYYEVLNNVLDEE